MIVTIEDRETLDVKDVESIYLELTNNGQLVKLKNVLHVPRISHNLLSIYRIAKAGNTITFTEKRCEVRKEGALITALDRKGIWTIEGRVAKPS